MKKRVLGNTNIKVAPLCLGGNVFGWTIDEQRSFEILDVFVDNDFNFIDTADVYSRWASGVGGESETIIGNWMKKKKNRKSIVLATKGGMDMGQGKTDVSKKYILKAAEASLKRLQTDYIDLYQTHKDDESVPVEDALEAYAKLIKEGKIKCVGASNFSPVRLKQALEASEKYGLPRYETLQPLYNLYDRQDFEENLESLCRQHNISVINYYSLAAGFLTGKYRNIGDTGKSFRGTKATSYLTDRGKKILTALDQVAEAHACELARIAMAWLASSAYITAPIASATTVNQLEEIMAGVKLKLSEKELSLLNQASNWEGQTNLK